MTNQSDTRLIDRRHYLKTTGVAAFPLAVAGCIGDDDDDDADDSPVGDDDDGDDMDDTDDADDTDDSEDLPSESMEIASSFGPEHVLVQAADRFKEIVEDESDGNFTVEITPGGAYGAIDEISEIVTAGGVDAHAGDTILFQQYAPEYNFVSEPFVVEGFEHTSRLIESDLVAPAIDAIRDTGNQRMLGNPIDRGARHLGVTEDWGAVHGPEDLEELPLRLPEQPTWVKIWSELGVEPTPVAWTEVYSALQQGVANAVEAPYGALNDSSLYEVIDVLNLTSHLVSTGFLWVNEDFYQGLPDVYQDIVNDAADEATTEASETVADAEADIREYFEDEGVEINEDVDGDAIREAARPAIEELFDEEWEGTWDEVLAI